MRRFILFLIFLILLAGAGLVIYGYVVDMPPPTGEITAPAAGVGFSE